MGLLTQNDAGMFQTWFKEMAKLRGIQVKYIYPVDQDVTIHSEIQSEFSDAIDLDVIFEENPKVNTLKRIGWVSENPDDKPYLAMLPLDTPQLQTKSRILIPPIGQAIPGRWFEITSIYSNLEYPDCYTCALVPVFETIKPRVDYSETNFNYIDDDRANQPDEDQPSNEPINGSFTFLANFNG